MFKLISRTNLSTEDELTHFPVCLILDTQWPPHSYHLMTSPCL